MFSRIRFAPVALAAVLFLSPGLPVSAQVMTVRQAVQHDVSAPLVEIAATAAKAPDATGPAEVVPRRTLPMRVGPVPDSRLRTSTQGAPAGFALTAGFSFEGLNNSNGFAPPDTNGAVGLTQYVQAVNVSFAVFSKSTGQVLLGPISMNALWKRFGGGCENNGLLHPMVTYDRMANRWIFSAAGPSGDATNPFLECVAVSTSPDATGRYNRYAFSYSRLNDAPKMGVWPDAYYEAFNVFNGGTFQGGEVCAYDRTAMLNAGPAAQICFFISGDGGFLPADMDGATPPPAGSPNYVMALFDTNNLELRRFHVDFATPGNSTFDANPTLIPVPAYTPLCGGNTIIPRQTTCIPQPDALGLGRLPLLDAIDDRLMYRAAYRNFGDHESVVVNHSIASFNHVFHGTVRWYEISTLAATPAVLRRGDVDPDTQYRWMGSAAMDSAGNVAVGYSISSGATFPSLGIFDGLTETVMAAGNGSQQFFNGTLSTWGTYSAMQIDPGDDCTFWFTGEYIKTTPAWDTRIGSARFSNCTTAAPPPPPSADALRFVSVTPCRIADTRLANGPFGGPFLTGQTVRGFTIPNSACNIPATAQAYSLNVTVVPHGALGFLTTFPCGLQQPLASTLNSTDGRVKAVAAIVPAGTNGDVCFFVTNDTDLVLDIDGYFVPVATPGSLSFYPVTPCRIVDTRLANGPFGGPSLVGGPSGTRAFPILSGPCPLPPGAQAYSLNYTAVPKTGTLGFLTTWPAGQAQPLVSTLNAPTGTVTANAAIVPAGSGGAIQVFVTNDSDLVIDVNGYFALPGAGGLSLFNLPPCRVLDTRLPAGSAPLNGSMDINVLTTFCGAPATAQSYVFNATVVPSPGGLGFLTLWPQGGVQPLVSTLNAQDAAVTSNMALVPTINTANNSVSAFTSSPSHLVLDISGYFAP